MQDQAKDLRRLVRECFTQDTAAPGRRPRLIVVTGGKGGVGTTTIAVNLAVALQREGLESLLVDADPHGGNVAFLCGLQERYTLADVLAGRRTVSEVLQTGNGAITVLPGVWGLEKLTDYPPTAGNRLLEQLNTSNTQADLIVLDAGNSAEEMTRRFCQAADLTLAVTTPETPSILDTYAAVKVLAGNQYSRLICSLINRAPDAEVAKEVHGRLAHASHRFLGISLQDAGYVPADATVAAAAAATEPILVAATECPAAKKIRRLAKTLTAMLADEKASFVADQNGEDVRTRMTA